MYEEREAEKNIFVIFANGNNEKKILAFVRTKNTHTTVELIVAKRKKNKNLFKYVLLIIFDYLQLHIE